MSRRWTYTAFAAAALTAAALAAAALAAAAGAPLVLALLRTWQPAPAETTAPAPTAPSAAAAPEAPAPAHHLPVDLEMARRELAAQLAARMNLEAEISRLREELARNQMPPEASSGAGADAGHRAFDEAALMEAGLDAEQIETIR
jgi:hypothetical protein